MHRHGYKGKKFNRERDQRNALMTGLADSLIKYESIETTITKAKEIVPYVEKLITKAKKGDLHNRRQIISDLQTIESAHKLVDEIAPMLNGRNSGHLRIERTRMRRGDNAQLARVSFVDDLKQAPVAKAVAAEPQTAVEKAAIKPKVVTSEPAKKAPVKKPAARKAPVKKEAK